MIDLKTLFKNHFNSVRISDDDLKKFAEDHLARITANNPDRIFEPILATTGAAYIAYFGAITNEDTARAVQQALTVNVDNGAAAFITFVRRKEGAIKSAFGEDGAQYQEFFPQGLTEYSRADRANIEQLMERFARAAETHAESLEDGLAAAARALQTSYQAARRSQLGKKGEVGDRIDTSADLRDTLETQLTANLHFVGWKFPGDIDQCMAYFDQSFLREDDADPATGGSGGTGDNPPA